MCAGSMASGERRAFLASLTLDIVLGVLIPFIVAFAILSPILLPRGLVIFGDATPPYNLTPERLLGGVPYAWTPYGESYTIPYSLGYDLLVAFLAALFPSEAALKLHYFLLYSLAGVCMYFGARRLLHDRSFRGYLACVVASEAFMLNVVNAEVTFIPSLAPGYFLLPLIFVLFREGLKPSSRGSRVLAAVLTVPAAAQPVYEYVYAFLLGVYTLFELVLHLRQKDGLARQILINAVSMFSFMLLLNQFWFLPTYFGNRYGLIHSGQIFTIDMLKGLSSDFVHSLTFNVSWSQPSLLGLVLPVLALSSIAVKPRQVLVVFFVGVAALFGFLAKGASPPGSEAYIWLAFGAPGSQVYGELLRNPSKLFAVVAFAYSFLFAFAILGIIDVLGLLSQASSRALGLVRLSRRIVVGKVLAVLLCVLVLAGVFAGAWPYFGDYVYESYRPVDSIPEAYPQVNAWLQAQQGYGKVLWVPASFDTYYSWAYGHPLMGFPEENSGRPFVGYGTPYGLNFALYSYFHSIIENRTDSLGESLSLSGVRYVVAHEDLSHPQSGSPDNELDLMMNTLKHQSDLRLVNADGTLSVFENTRNITPFFTPSQSAVVFGGLDALNALEHTESFNAKDWALYFYEQKPSKEELIRKLAGGATLVLYDRSMLDVALSLADDGSMYAPFESTIQTGDPENDWAKVWVPSIEWWLFYERQLGLGVKSDFDMGRGAVYTNVEGARISFPVQVSEAGLQIVWARMMRSPLAGQVLFYLDGKPLNITQSSTKASEGFEWIRVGSFDAKAGIHNLIVENKNGFNALNLVAVMSKDQLDNLYAKVENMIQEEHVRVVKLFSSNLTLKTGSGWSLSRAWGGTSTNGYLALGEGKVNATLSFTPTVDADYVLAIRLLRSPEGGLLRVGFGGRWFELPSRNVSSEFTWTYLGPAHLSSRTTVALEGIGRVGLDSIAIYPLTPSPSSTVHPPLPSTGHSAKLLEFHMIDPTSWELTVNSPTPLVLVFAESYDPLWTATIEGTSLPSEPLYSLVNGFQFPQSGLLKIRLEYHLQNYLSYGAAISGISLVVLLVYGLGYRPQDFLGNHEPDPDGTWAVLRRRLFASARKVSPAFFPPDCSIPIEPSQRLCIHYWRRSRRNS